MFRLLSRLWRFVTTMDARAWTSLFVSTVLLAFVVAMFLFGERWLGLEEEGRVETFLAEAAGSPYAVIGVISVYILLALTGFPQILLIAATVFAFGPQMGAAYAWIATLTSAILTFYLGGLLGGGAVRRIGGGRVRAMIDFLGRHGALASFLIRIVPSAPFIVVNAAAGAAHIPLWKYVAGTGAGIVPKILLVAVLGAVAPDPSVLDEGVEGVVEFFTSRDPVHLAILAVAVPAWLALLLAARALYLRLRAGPK